MYFFLLCTILKIFAISGLSENNRMLQVTSLVLFCIILTVHVENTEMMTLLKNSEHDTLWGYSQRKKGLSFTLICLY